MHSLYKEHDGSYVVGIPWQRSYALGGASSTETQWHTLFSGLSLSHAIRVVHYLNGGEDKGNFGVFLTLLEECAA